MPHNTNTTKVRGFAGLINTVDPEELSGYDRSKFPVLAAENVYLTNGRRLKSRPGYALSTAGNYHSLWSTPTITLVASEGELRSLDTDLNETVLDTGLVPNSQISYAEAADRVYYMNANGERGMIQDGARSPWGIPAPGAGILTSTTGAMPAGTYRVGVTQRLDTGVESGVLDLPSITISAGEGISVHLPSPDADAVEFSIYCSHAGGQNLFAAATVPYTTTTHTITNTTSFGQMIKTLDVIEPPSGTQILYHYGRMYIVVGRYLYYSDALAHSWFRDDQFFAFPDSISLAAPVDGGIYVSADKTYYLQGTDPKSMSQTDVSDAQAVAGTLEYLYPGDAPDINKPHAVWISDRGFVLGAPGGSMTLLTEDQFTFAVSAEGSLNLVKRDGVATLIGLMESPSDDVNDFRTI